MNKKEVYNKRIRPLMRNILKICKENQIAFAAQFMTDETNSYISFYKKGSGSVHIAEVLDEMLFSSMDKYDQAVTCQGICFQNEWYLNEDLRKHIGEKVSVIYSNGYLDVISKEPPFDLVTKLFLSQ